MSLSESLEKIMTTREISAYSLAQNTGVSADAIGKWLKGTQPTLDKLELIAEYFDISLDELAGRVPPQHTEQETKLLEMFSKMDEKQKQALLDYADYIVSR